MQPRLNKRRGSVRSLISTLRYFRKFQYPLTLREIWYWQPLTRYPETSYTDWPDQWDGWFYLPGRYSDVTTRRRREIVSRTKLAIARKTAGYLQYLPSVTAVYLTGSLAMNNCEPGDDIDLMIICYPNTLWLTRLLVVVLLHLTVGRRPAGLSEHRSVRVADRICDNLYLDTDHLAIDRLPVGQSARTAPARLYLSHEILQARCLYGRGSTHSRFIRQNSWVKTYLPVAYAESVKRTDSSAAGFLPSRPLHFLDCLLKLTNWCLFRLQYFHMRRRLTAEKVGTGYAFFHPRRIRNSR